MAAPGNIHLLDDLGLQSGAFFFHRREDSFNQFDDFLAVLAGQQADVYDRAGEFRHDALVIPTFKDGPGCDCESQVLETRVGCCINLQFFQPQDDIRQGGNGIQAVGFVVPGIQTGVDGFALVWISSRSSPRWPMQTISLV